jgi:hypothetical protein
MNTDAFTDTHTETFTGLTPRQADGLACVACGADYLRVRVAHRPVGRSVTGSSVFVCSPACPDPAADIAADIAMDIAADTGGAAAGGDAR